MNDTNLDQDPGQPQFATLLEAQLLRKATAEADQAEALAQQQKAMTRQTLKSSPDAPPSAGVVAEQEPEPPADKPPAAAGGSSSDAATTPPKGAAKPREGAVTLDDKAGYMTTLVAYRAMLRHADAVAGAINALGLQDARIMLVDTLEYAAGDVALLGVSTQLAAWHTELERLNTLVLAELAKTQKAAAIQVDKALTALFAPIMAAGLSPTVLLPLLAGAVSATADLVGYFKTDYAISGKDVSVSDTAVRARVAGQIKGVPVYLQEFYRVEQSPIINAFADVTQKRATLQQNLDQLKNEVLSPLSAEIAALTAEIERLQAQIGKLKLPADAQKKRELEEQLETQSAALSGVVSAKREPQALYERGIGAIALVDETNKDLTTIQEGQELSPLLQAALRDYLSVLGITHLLFVSVASAGGEVVTGKNWFLGPVQAGYLGGGVVTFLLCDTSGAILAADTFAGTDYLKFKLGQDLLG